MSNYRTRLPESPSEVDFNVSFETEDYEYSVEGQAYNVEISTDAEYEEVEFDGSSRPFIASRETTMTFRLKNPYMMKRKNKKVVETVIKAITLDVPDKTYQSVSDARKRGGVPKTATFEFGEKYNRVTVTSTPTITFTWSEEL